MADEIYTSVSHVEPWQTGTTRVPSTAFCLLMKFFLMRLTTKQMKGLLNTGDCAYVRAIGFLYLRYTCPPKDLYMWFEPYLEDEEEFNPSSDTAVTLTMGAYLINLLSDMHYYNTTLPRIPVPIERKIKVMLLMLSEKQRRRQANQRDEERGKYIKGTKVSAIYSDDDNEPAWYDAVIDSRDREGEENSAGGAHRYWVTFTAYGNTESVDLGDMKLSEEREGHGGERGRSRSRSRERDGKETSEPGNLLTQVLDKERQGSVAVGKNY
ncbi:Prpf38b, partial [Symbiodinium microadriaticum]